MHLFWMIFKCSVSEPTEEPHEILASPSLKRILSHAAGQTLWFGNKFGTSLGSDHFNCVTSLGQEIRGLPFHANRNFTGSLFFNTSKAFSLATRSTRFPCYHTWILISLLPAAQGLNCGRLLPCVCRLFLSPAGDDGSLWPSTLG